MRADRADRLTAASRGFLIGGERTSNPVHICFIAVHIYPVLVADSGINFVGGAEVQQSVQMRALQRAGYKISVLVKDHGQPDFVNSEGISIHKIPPGAGRGLPGMRFFHPRMSDVVRLLSRVAPDIVFVQTAGEQVAAAALYARTAGKRFIFAGASDPDFALGSLPGMPNRHVFMYRLGLRGAHAVIVQNVAQQRMLKKNFGKDGYLVQNGFEEPSAKPGQFAGPILWAATVKPLKRPDLFIELARRVPERCFIMVGGPGVTPDAQSYVESIARLAQEVPNLRMVGHVPYHEVAGYFDGAALAINTSDYEGFPNTFMQAWFRGTPTLSFVRPESAPGSTGTLACANLNDMVERVRLLSSDEQAWVRESSRCRQHFHDHHTIDSAVRRYEAIFSKVLHA